MKLTKSTLRGLFAGILTMTVAQVATGELLRYGIRQSIYGNNTLHINRMFNLPQDQWGKTIRSVVVSGYSLQGSTTLSLFMNGVDQGSASLPSLYQNHQASLSPRFSNRVIGDDVRDVEVAVYGNTYIESVWIDVVTPARPAVWQIRLEVYDGFPVVATGLSPEALFDDCYRQVFRPGMTVRRASISGYNLSHTAGGWTADQICSLAALNATQPGLNMPVRLAGTIRVQDVWNDIPLQVIDSADRTYRRTLETYLPRFLGSSLTYSYNVNGVYDSNRWGWPAWDLVAILRTR